MPSGEDVVATCGRPAAIRLEADRDTVSAAWGGLAYVTAAVVDEAGDIVPYADDELLFAVAGAGALLAAGTNDPVSEESYTGPSRHAFEGTALAAVRSTGAAGDIILTVSAEGLTAAQIVITAK
jgi:beta-galactosidase